MLARTLVSTLFLIFTGFFSNVFAANPRIAVAAEGAKAEAAVSAVAGRAPHILIFDAQGKLLSAQPNPVAKLSGGAGPALARWLADNKVNVMVAGSIGDKMAVELMQLKIRAVTGSGPAQAAAKAAAK